MEEDIKVLEEMLKARKKQKEIIECAGGYCGNCNPDIKALKNAIQTIKAYKELEEENSLLIQQNITYKININDLKHNNIPVSLVEETIEELDKEYKDILSDYGNIDTDVVINIPNENVRKHCEKLVEKIIVLQELLEKRK